MDITGTPTAAGSVTFDVTATDTTGASTSDTYSFTIDPCLTVSAFAFDAAADGVDVDYSVLGGALSQNVPVSLEWASGTALGDELAAVAGGSFTIPAGTQTKGPPVEQHFAGSLFQSPPAGAEYVLAVVGDPTSADFDPATDLYALPIDNLVFSSGPPGSMPAGSPFGVTVTAKYLDGSVDQGFTGDVAIAQANSNSALGGTVSMAAVQGQATFPNLTLDSAQTGGTLQASSNGAGSGTSAPFDVVAGPAAALAIVSSAQTLDAGQPSAPITVELEDQYQNPVAAGASGVRLTLSSTSVTGSFLDTNGKPLPGATLVIRRARPRRLSSTRITTWGRRH